MIMDADIHAGGRSDQPTGCGAIRFAWRWIARRVIVDDYERSRPDFKRSPQDGPRMQDNGGYRPACQLFVAEQMIACIEKQNVKALIGLVREPAVKIFEHRVGR